MKITDTDTLYDNLNVIYDTTINILADSVYFYEHLGIGPTDGTLFELNIYPNPADGAVFIEYRLENPAYVETDLYSVNGILVQNIASGLQPEGTYIVEFDADLAPGIYFLKFRVGETMYIKKLMIN